MKLSVLGSVLIHASVVDSCSAMMSILVPIKTPDGADIRHVNMCIFTVSLFDSNRVYHPFVVMKELC